MGGSFGRLLAITFAGTYPDEVSGLVLLDATLPTQDETASLPEIPVTYIGAEPIEPPVSFVTISMDPIVAAIPGRIIEEIERVLELAGN